MQAQAFSRHGKGDGDLAAAVFHIIGAALSIGALVILVLRGTSRNSSLLIVGYSLYGACLLYYFIISALSHLLRSPGARRVFGGLDEAGSYFLVAGSWTPLCFGPFHGALGWTLFGLLWGLALANFLAATSFIGGVRNRLLALYYVVVTLVLPLIRPLRILLSEALFAWLMLAGSLYTIGLLFRSREDMPYNHGIWHAFVLAASVCHFFGLLSAA